MYPTKHLHLCSAGFNRDVHVNLSQTPDTIFFQIIQSCSVQVDRVVKSHFLVWLLRSRRPRMGWCPKHVRDVSPSVSR